MYLKLVKNDTAEKAKYPQHLKNYKSFISLKKKLKQ